MDNRAIGTIGERMAEALLVLKGYEILRRNYRFEGREIDLLVAKNHNLVAVEVKLRRGARFGRAIEAIDQRKLARIRAALVGALRQSKKYYQPRVDVVVIDLDDRLEKMTVHHLEGMS